MSLTDKLKSVFANKKITSKEVDAFLDTEEGEDLMIAKIQKAMPNFLQQAQPEPEKQKVEPIETNPKTDDIFEDKKEGGK